MTSDQLTSAVKARGGLTPGFFDCHGWGFCIHIVTERDELGFSPGSYGWNGGLGTSWYVDPTKQLAGILLTNRAFESPGPAAAIQGVLAYCERVTLAPRIGNVGALP